MAYSLPLLINTFSVYSVQTKEYYLDRVKRLWYLLPIRAAKVQASLRIRAVSPEPSLLAHTSSESRGTFRQKARSLAPLNGWACAVKLCHDGMLEDTNSLDGAQLMHSHFHLSFTVMVSIRIQMSWVNTHRTYDLYAKDLSYLPDQ